MNNCRAGLYSFASTMTWLHETGMASPPLLVVLGLTLPDSRILSGIASIGLTLANIAIILPHLRQPILDSMQTLGGALARDQSTKEEINLSLDESNATQKGDLPAEGQVLASGSLSKREHHSPLPICSAAVESVRSQKMGSLGSPDVESSVAPQTTLPSPAGKTDDSQILSQTPPSLGADSSERHVGSSHLFVRKGRDVLYIPLPVPDADEVAFFNMEDDILSDSDPGEEWPVASCGKHTVPEDRFVIEDYGSTAGEDNDQDSELVAVDPPSIQSGVELRGGSINVAMPVADEKVTSPPTSGTIQGHHIPLVDLLNCLPAHGPTVRSALAKHPLIAAREAPGKRRPESLEFIPQSVIRRYTSAPMASAERCPGHRAFNSGHDHQVLPAPPLIFVHNPEILLQGTRPRANYATLEGYWGASLLTPTRRLTGGQTFAGENVPVQEPVEQESASLLEPLTVHEITPPQKRPAHRRRLGVLARAALRDRRSAVRRCGDDENDETSTSDSDSDFDNDSQFSGGSSAYESMLPHVLGADLIAAIDANSESELNLFGLKKTKLTPLNVHEDFLISEDSAADISMVMHVSSNDDASDGELEVPTTFRSLTYEDIQQWATGVVQKCVRQVCRNHVAAEPSSPSQASDVCAERPSGPGASQCPLSGLHCRLGGATLTEVPVLRTKEGSVSLPPTSTLQSRKPFQVRNLRDIPEFIPRQRHVSTMTGRVEDPLRPSTRSTMDATRDAVARVIARMENQAGFNTPRGHGGETDGRHGWQTARCAKVCLVRH